MNHIVLRPQLLRRLGPVGVGLDAGGGAHQEALRLFLGAGDGETRVKQACEGRRLNIASNRSGQGVDVATITKEGFKRVFSKNIDTKVTI